MARGNQLSADLVVVGALQTLKWTTVGVNPNVAYVAAGTTTFDPSTAEVFTITTATGNSNFAMTTAGNVGQKLTFIIANDAGGARTITFTTNFKTATTLVGSASKSCVISFISDGTNWWELSRSGAATATTGM